MSEAVTQTDYTIHKEDGRLTVFENMKPFTKWFMTQEDALHSIWQTNGAIQHHFYVSDKDGFVVCVNRGVL